MNDQELTDRFTRAARALPDPTSRTVTDVRSRARQRRHRRRGLVAATVVPLLVLGGFLATDLATSDPSPVISPLDDPTSGAWDVPVHPLPSDLADATWTSGGQPLPVTVAHIIRGPEHCGWHDALLLNLGWPLGTASTSTLDARQYVRDPDGSLPDARLQERFATGRQVPEGSVDTGYRVGEVELWLGPDEGDEAVFLRFPDRVERWPHDRAFSACL